MAAKALSSKKKEEEVQPASSDEHMEEEEEEEEEEGYSSGDEDENSSEEDQENVTSPPKKLLSETQPQESESESEAESLESPSAFQLQYIPKPSVNKEKRTQEQISDGRRSSKSSKKSKIVEKSGSDFLSTPTRTRLGGHRLWDDGDEVALLKGLLESKNLKNRDIVGAAYDNIKEKLNVDVSKDQFRDKASRMKKRFSNVLKKGHDGMDPVFSKSHDLKVFELSKELWGVADGENTGSKVDACAMIQKTSAKKKENVPDEEEDLKKNQKNDEGKKVLSNFPFIGSSFNDTTERFPSLEMTDDALKIVKAKLCLIENTKAKELNEKWKKLLIEEAELQCTRLTLMKEQIKLALDQ